MSTHSRFMPGSSIRGIRSAQIFRNPCPSFIACTRSRDMPDLTDSCYYVIRQFHLMTSPTRFWLASCSCSRWPSARFFMEQVEDRATVSFITTTNSKRLHSYDVYTLILTNMPNNLMNVNRGHIFFPVKNAATARRFRRMQLWCR